MPYGVLLDGEEKKLGEDEVGVEDVGVLYMQVGEVEEVEVPHRHEVRVPHKQVVEVQSLPQVCPGKDLLLLLPPGFLLGEGSRCSPRCSL